MLNKRFAKGRIKLKEGEYQRPNGTFEYKWTDRFGKRHSVYARTILDLRAKEEKILRDNLDGDGFTRNYLVANRRLNRNFELLTRNNVLELFGKRSTALISLFSMNYNAQRVANIVVKQYVKLNKVAWLVTLDFVV